MTQLLTSSADHLLADLVEELSRKLAEGHSADVEAFLADHGDHAEKLRPLIPTLQMLVEIGSSPVAASGSRANLSEGNGHETYGHPVLGDFRILREVGRGGMGVVYEAEQISLRRRVALKVLPSAAMLDPRALQRFRNEAQAAAALHHSQIVPIFGVGCERGMHYYAMQFIDGLTLAEVITALRESAGLAPLFQPDPPAKETAATVGRDSNPVQKNGEADGIGIPSYKVPAPKTPSETDVLAALSTEKSRTSPAWFRRIAEQFAQVAEALHHAHELGVTHRDIKPANLMLDRLGHIWITDFGLARIEGEGNLTMTGDLIGTLRYMSPEQSLAKRIGIDHRTDFYSLGITLYELLTLHPGLPGHSRQELLRQIAFEEPKPPRKHNRDIPRDLETIVLKMIEKNPAERYQTAADLGADLKRFVDDRHITARRPTLYVRASRWAKRRQGLVTATVVILLLIGAGCLGWSFDHSRRVSKATALVNDALQETALRRVEAQTKRDDLIAWEQAASSAQRAEALAVSGLETGDLVNLARDTATEIEVAQRNARVRVEIARRDARMLKDLTIARLESATSMQDGHFDRRKAHEAYSKAFNDYGINFSKPEPEEIARQVRDSSIREDLVNGLLDWALQQGKSCQEKPEPSFLLAVAENAATESPGWHRPLIQALRSDDLGLLQAQAASVSQGRLPPVAIVCVFLALNRKDDTRSGLSLLLEGVKRHPGDFWINEWLGKLLADANPTKANDAVAYMTAAVALRPESPGARSNLALAQATSGHVDEAMATIDEAIRLQPDFANAHHNRASFLWKQGRREEAFNEYRIGIRLDPDNALIHYNVGCAYSQTNRWDEAIDAYNTAIRIKADYVSAHYNLGIALQAKDRLTEAVAAYQEAIRRGHPDAFCNLGAVYLVQDNLDEAIATLTKGLQLTPDHADAHFNLVR